MVRARTMTDCRRAETYQQRLNRDLRAITRCNEVLVLAEPGREDARRHRGGRGGAGSPPVQPLELGPAAPGPA